MCPHILNTRRQLSQTRHPPLNSHSHPLFSFTIGYHQTNHSQILHLGKVRITHPTLRSLIHIFVQSTRVHLGNAKHKALISKLRLQLHTYLTRQLLILPPVDPLQQVGPAVAAGAAALRAIKAVFRLRVKTQGRRLILDAQAVRCM